MEENKPDNELEEENTVEEGYAPEIDGGVQNTEESEQEKAGDVGKTVPEGFRPRGFGVEVCDWFDYLFHAVIIVMVVFTFLTRAATVDGTSMLPTLEDKQLLMISELGYEPEHNDIVVVWSGNLPNSDGSRGKAIVKRVIGLPGDHIQIDFSAGRVTRNGTELEVLTKDGQLYEDGHKINTLTNDDEFSSGDFTVPEGHLFVMGDNRNGSTDSRSYLIGYIERREVIGKAYLRFWPLDKFGGLYE